MKYKVIRDSSEKEGHGWLFAPSKVCLGTEVRSLYTADYTIVGHEESFVIERKGSVAEFYGNLFEERFIDELERLDQFVHPFAVLEFTMSDILSFPYGSGIPKRLWRKLRNKGPFILKTLLEFELRYKTRFILAGKKGKEVAQSLFKRILELNPEGGPL